MRIEEALDDAPEVGDDDPKLVNGDLLAKESELEPESELESEPEGGVRTSSGHGTGAGIGLDTRVR